MAASRPAGLAPVPAPASNPAETEPSTATPSTAPIWRDSVTRLDASPSSRAGIALIGPVLAGVNTWRVDYAPLTREIEAAGLVEFNERLQRTVPSRVNGRIDRLLVDVARGPR